MVATFAGLSLDRPRLMGIVNVTPDSFSDGGTFLDPRAAIDHGERLIEQGADILDIGGESTRPEATPLSPSEEIDRVLPVIEGLSRTGIPLSLDSRHAATMEAALRAGVRILNDVTAFRAPENMAVVAHHKPSVILMHMHGTPQTMQNNPVYADVVAEVRECLTERIAAARHAGLAPEQIAVDVGIGFGKTVAHNKMLLRHLADFNMLGAAQCLGVSRKSFLAALSPSAAQPHQRLAGTIAAILAAHQQGVRLHRVHDVGEIRQALDIYTALQTQ